MSMITIPDASWYEKKSREGNVADECPYANVHKCPRYYGSLYMLGKTGMITSIAPETCVELDAIWENSGLSPVIAEEDTGITSSGDKTHSFQNFCPEVSFKFFRYYASFLAKHSDDIDRECAYHVAERDNLENDWRYEWASLSPCHYLECSIYKQVEKYHENTVGKFDLLAHPNVVSLIGRMENCLEDEDPSGVLHAAANILETVAKDVVQSPSIQNSTLGSFIDKYNNISALPEEIKGVVKSIYNLRSTTPLAGHGSTSKPELTMADAVVVAALAKFVAEIEYRMRKI